MYEGLSQQEFDDIHEAVAEAMAYVTTPVTFYRPAPVEVDDLYAEAVNGDDNMSPFATLRASVRFEPDEDTLTGMGLRPDTDLLVFLPRKHILDWEAATGETFSVEQGMELVWHGMRFSVSEPERTDPLPVGDGAVEEYIGMVIVAESSRP